MDPEEAVNLHNLQLICGSRSGTAGKSPRKESLPLDFQLGEGVVAEAGDRLGLLRSLRTLDFNWSRTVVQLGTGRGCGIRRGRRGRRTFKVPGMFRPFIARQRTDHDIDRTPGKLRRKIRMAVGSNLRQKPLDDLKSKLCMGIFPAAELESDFHLHVLAEKVNGVPNFDARNRGGQSSG